MMADLIEGRVSQCDCWPFIAPDNARDNLHGRRQSPPAALPPPKKEEPKAEACPLTTADLVAPLPKASDITNAQPAVEKPAFNRWLQYTDDGWR
jgi:hypothetical protein